MSVHSHRRDAGAGQRELLIALGLTAAMMFVELVAGWFSGSLSLLADAGHMLTDASALGFSWLAAWMATRPAAGGKTYGWARTEILAALANGVALCSMVVWIAVRALQRLQQPTAVNSGLMILAAFAGLAVNLACGWLLSPRRRESLNV